MTLPSAASLPAAPLVPPGAQFPMTTLTELLTRPDVCCTSLNLSVLPDGRFRGTILRADGRAWLKGYGTSPEAAIEALVCQVDQ